jgi:hypothetical protein
MRWESSGEKVEIFHDNAYKSLRYQYPIVIPVDALMTMKLQGLLCLNTLMNVTLNPKPRS